MTFDPKVGAGNLDWPLEGRRGSLDCSTSGREVGYIFVAFGSLRKNLSRLMEVITFDISGTSMVILGICLTGQSLVGLAGRLKDSLSPALSQV